MDFAIKRIIKDKREIEFYNDSINPMFTANHSEDSLFLWRVTFHTSTFLYQTKVDIEITLPETYPFHCPIVKCFNYKHECISDNGTITLFNDDWSPAINLGALIITIISFFPNKIHDGANQIKRTSLIKEELMQRIFRFNLR